MTAEAVEVLYEFEKPRATALFPQSARRVGATLGASVISLNRMWTAGRPGKHGN